MIAGLYIEQAESEKRMAALAFEITAPGIQPADEHSKREQLERIRRERLARERHILANEKDHAELEAMIEVNKHLSSRHRAIFRTLLEQASDRLRRELGDKPESLTNFYVEQLQNSS